MAYSAAGSLDALNVSVNGISPISGVFCADLKKNHPLEGLYAHLTGELVKKSLGMLMSSLVPG